MSAPLLPVLHVVTPAGSWLEAWHVDPALTVLLLVVAFGYVLARRSAARLGRPVPSRWRLVAFLAGLEVVAVALMGPPDHANAARFSVHMLQHTLLVLVAAPLLALGHPVRTFLRGLPSGTLRSVVAYRGVTAAGAVITHPVVVFAAASLPFVLWHYPPFYEAAVRDPFLHDLEHLSFLGGAFLFWWRLVEPFPRHRRLGSSARLLLVFAVWMATDLVCAAVTLAPRPLYGVYVETARLWGIDPLADQRLGGALMWVAGGMLYAVLLLGLLVRTVRPSPVGRERSRPPAWGPRLIGLAGAALGVVPLAFVVFGLALPNLARATAGDVRWEREDPRLFELRVAEFVAAYRVGERDGVPVVAPPPGGDAYLVGRSDGWYPILALRSDADYRLHISSRDVAHAFFVDLAGERMTVRVVPGEVAVVTLRPRIPGTYPILCTELCGPVSREMTGLLIVER